MKRFLSLLFITLLAFASIPLAAFSAQAAGVDISSVFTDPNFLLKMRFSHLKSGEASQFVMQKIHRHSSLQNISAV
jgi:hypothetical protein